MKYITLFVLGVLAFTGSAYVAEGADDTSVNSATYVGTTGSSTTSTTGTKDDSDGDAKEDALTDGLMIIRNKDSDDPGETSAGPALLEIDTVRGESAKGQVEAEWKVEKGEKSQAIEPDEIDNKSNDDEEDKDEGEEHRSAVAAFVAELHRIASSTPGGIGEKVREVARQQNDDNQDVSDKLSKVEKRGSFLRFFIGTDQDSLEVLIEAASTTQAHIDELEKIKLEASASVQASLEKEIKTLTKELERIQKVTDKNKDVFSLFGWLVNLFD